MLGLTQKVESWSVSYLELDGRSDSEEKALYYSSYPSISELVMIVIYKGKRYQEHIFTKEEEFEKEVIKNHKKLFHEDTIFIDAKRKIGSGSLGNSIPDGFLFDMADPENREFYIVEFELQKHDFYKHIFPQITKFFAFYKNPKRQKELVEKLFSVVDSDALLKKQFKSYLGHVEIYKFINDVIDSSQNILLAIDGDKNELPEITDTYSDTWGKMVKVIIIKKFVQGNQHLYTIHPEFESIDFSYLDAETEDVEDTGIYTDEFHLEGVSGQVKKAYFTIKEKLKSKQNIFLFNPQKYYISIKAPRNIVFIKFRKTKMRLVIMMSEHQLRRRIKKHKIRRLSEGVQGFYNGPCASVDVDDSKNLGEIIRVIKEIAANC